MKTLIKFITVALIVLVFVALAVSTSGCSVPHPATAPEPVVTMQTVDVPTPVPCAALAKLGDEPAYPDTDEALLAVPGATKSEKLFNATKLLTKGRLMRIKRLSQYMAAKVACVF